MKKGTKTNKGTIKEILYLTFSKQGWPTAIYTKKPIPGGKGLIVAKIKNQYIPLGELTIQET